MLKKIVSLILITISSFFIINNFKEVKDYDDNVDLLIPTTWHIYSLERVT